MLEVIERSPLDEVDELPLGWISHEAAPLIAEILGLLSDPGAARELGAPPAALERAASIRNREGNPREEAFLGEFAALQTLLIEALRPRDSRAGPPRVHARSEPPGRGVRRRPGAAMESLVGPERAKPPPA